MRRSFFKNRLSLRGWCLARSPLFFHGKWGSPDLMVRWSRLLMVVGSALATHPSASRQGYPPLRQHQGQALRVRASPAALTLPAFRVFCHHAEWLVVCRTRTMQQAQLVPSDVSYLTDFTHSFLVKFDDGESPLHINVRDQEQPVCHREC